MYEMLEYKQSDIQQSGCVFHSVMGNY